MDEKETKKIIGLMSGTSCDSIDAAYCEVNPDFSVNLIHGINFSYPEHIKSKIFSLLLFLINTGSRLDSISDLSNSIGEKFS